MSSERINEAEQHELDVIDAIVRGGGEARPEDAALTDFALLVRNARPVPHHGEVAALDERFEGSYGRSGARMNLVFRPALAGFCALILLVGVVGSAYMESERSPGGESTIDGIMAEREGSGANSLGSTGSDAGTELSTLPAPEVPAYGDSAKMATTTTPMPEAEFSQSPAGSPLRGSSRDVAWNAELILGAKAGDFDELTERVNEITEQFDGYIADSNVKVRDEDHGVAGFTLMIPAKNRADALAAYSKLGNVRSREQSSEDITTGANSAERALKQARARVDRLEDRLAAAATTEQRLTLRRQLSVARSRERSAARQARANRARVNYVPISLTIAADSAADERGKGTIGKAVSTAGMILTGAVAGVILVAAVLVPISLIVLVGLFGWRRWGRRRSERTLEDAAAPKAE